MPDLTDHPQVMTLRFALRSLAEDIGEQNTRRVAHIELDRLAEHAKIDRELDDRLRMEGMFQAAMDAAQSQGALAMSTVPGDRAGFDPRSGLHGGHKE